MIDRLRRSLDELEVPTCPNCHIDMKWYWSYMVSPSPLTVNHYFSCTNCSRVIETKQELSRSIDTPPPNKLSAPASRFYCAA